jgi:hypothetical protein
MIWSDPFEKCKSGQVSDLTRADRVALLGRAAKALLDGRLPDDAARLFLAGGLLSWLSQGGSLTKDFWRVCGKQGSNHTESVLWRQIESASGSTTNDDNKPTLNSSSTENRKTS